MFDELSGKLENIFKKLKGQHRLSEDNIKAYPNAEIAIINSDGCILQNTDVTQVMEERANQKKLEQDRFRDVEID